MTKKVCLVIGAGGGIGANIARKFAIEGYHSCLARRTDQDGLDKWIKNIEAEGGEAGRWLLKDFLEWQKRFVQSWLVEKKALYLSLQQPQLSEVIRLNTLTLPQWEEEECYANP